MNENQLMRLIIDALEAGAEQRIPEMKMKIKRAYQPTQQGAEKGPTWYCHKMPDRRYGHLQRTDVWDEVNERMVHTESQKYESDFQVNAMFKANPADIRAYTASDLANIAASIMQSDATIALFRDKKVGLLRITEVRNPYFLDDKDQNEESPSFDFTVTYDRVAVSYTPVVTTTEFNVQRV